MSVWRIRLVLGLISMVTIGLELALMRILSLRHWHHLAYMTISVALLGFAAGGTLLAFLRPRDEVQRFGIMRRLTLAFALVVPLMGRLVVTVPLDVQFLVWDWRQAGGVLLIELLMSVPFFLGGTVIALALMTSPDRVAGHYAANLAGSGAGALVGVALMFALRPDQLPLAFAGPALAAYLFLSSPRPWKWLRVGAAVVAVFVSVLVGRERGLRLSPYSLLSQLQHMPGVDVVHLATGPLGTLHHATGESIHATPGLSLNCPEPVPRHSLLIVDGCHASPVYACEARQEWGFLDWTLPAAAYRVLPRPTIGPQQGASLRMGSVDSGRTSNIERPTSNIERGHAGESGMASLPNAVASPVVRISTLDVQRSMFDVRCAANSAVCLIGAGGGGQIGLALYHGALNVVALEHDANVIHAMEGPLRDSGGGIYTKDGVTVLRQEARAHFAMTERNYDLIQLPPFDGFGASGGGVLAAHESYLYTVEAFADMLAALRLGGVLCVTRWARTPPRDGLRLFDTAAQALARLGVAPGPRLILLRNMWCVTVLASPTPYDEVRLAAVRQFCQVRGFDVAHLPDMREHEANRYHLLTRPYYADGAAALLGAERQTFLDSYLFDVAAVTDDRPYFFRFCKWRSFSRLWTQLGQASRAFLEAGHVLLVVALMQVIVLAGGLILIPAVGRSCRGRTGQRRAPILVYFGAIGTGFMLLEMAFLQRLILFLAHPVYAAALAIAAFLTFAGAGSWVSRRWSPAAASGAALAVVVVAGCYAFWLGWWLSLWLGQATWVRVAIAWFTVAPLAFPMGMLFPAGMRRLGVAAPGMVPWAWAINGAASVTAAVATPLLAMQWGFSCVLLIALVCYAVAGGLVRWLPGRQDSGRQTFPSALEAK